MNCQEFRSKWPDETDSDLLAHIETCDACIAWIESLMVGDEEVQFLKENPSPPADLEERIMQTIYQNAGQVTLPPHAAATALFPETARAANAGKWRAKKLPLAWASAAAVLLVTGMIGYQELQAPEHQIAQESSGAPQMAEQGQEEVGPLLTFDNKAASTSSGTASSDQESGAGTMSSMAESAPSITEKETASNESRQEAASSQSEAAEPSKPAALADANASAANAVASPNEAEANKAIPAGENAEAPAAREEHPTIASRSGTPQPQTESPSKPEAATAKEAVPARSGAAVAKQPSTHSVAATVVPEQNVFALTMVPDAKMEATSISETGDAHILMGPPAPKERSGITLSTFTDIQTAAQASDLPIPVFSQLPGGFALSEISVRYESETSHKANGVRTDYTRGGDWVRVEVERNHQSKRSLAIPGTFTATQLFSVDDEQAIGVTYEKSDQETGARHAVHFNAEANGQSLYVVMTARGVTLEELIDTAKRIGWSP